MKKHARCLDQLAFEACEISPPRHAMMNRRHILAGAMATLLAGRAAAATGDASVLTIHGAIAGGGNEPRKFSLNDLMAMQQAQVTTKTPWDGVETEYRGTALQALYTAVGGFGSVLHLRALNDYAATITVKEMRDNNPIVAWQRNGKLMPVADKGPLFVIFPFSANPKLWNEEFFAKCVWQLCDIEIGD